MWQPDNKDKNRNNASTGSATAAEQYLEDISAYRGAVSQISDWLLHTPMIEIVKRYDKIKEAEEQIVDVINFLENLGRSPAGIRFNKNPALKALKKARVELNKIPYIAEDSDRQKGALSLDHIDPCRDYLIMAIKYMIPQRG